VYQILVELVSDTGDADRTIGLARERVAAARAGFGADNPRTSPSEIMLAGVLMNFGQTDEAGKLLAHAGTVLDRAGDQTSIERARLWRWQGNLELLSKGRVPWQVHPLRRALDLLRARYPDDDELMAALSTAPTAACNSGDAAAALQAANELAVLAARRYGPSSLYALDARVSRAEIQLRTGAAAEAVQSLRGALQESGRLLGESHPNAVMHRLFLARALGVMGQQAESARYFAEARQLLDRFHAGDTRLGGAYEGIQAQVKRIATGRLPHCGD